MHAEVEARMKQGGQTVYEILQTMLLNNIKAKVPASRILALDFNRGAAVVETPKWGDAGRGLRPDHPRDQGLIRAPADEPAHAVPPLGCLAHSGEASGTSLRNDTRLGMCRPRDARSHRCHGRASTANMNSGNRFNEVGP